MTTIRSRLLLLSAGAMAVCGLSTMDGAKAAPFYAAQPDSAPMIESVDWTMRCFWVQRGWGPERRCRRVWVGGPGWGPPGAGWGRRPPPGPGWGPPPPPPGYGPPRGYYGRPPEYGGGQGYGQPRGYDGRPPGYGGGQRNDPY